MKQKRLINIVIVIAASAVLLVVWFMGLDWLYAKLLTLGANFFFLFSHDTSISLKMDHDVPSFLVETIVDGRKGSYPQTSKLIILPFVMVLTWQILLFFNISSRKAAISAIENILIFYIIQVIYLLLLSSYYNSSVIKFFYDLLRDSFYILALFLIIKDTIRYRLISFVPKES